MLSVEWGKYGIGVVCVAPGWIDTEGMRRYGDDLAEIAELVPMRRLGTAEEVGDMIAFLASPRRRYITGTDDRHRRRPREHRTASWPGVTAD